MAVTLPRRSSNRRYFTQHNLATRLRCADFGVAKSQLDGRLRERATDGLGDIRLTSLEHRGGRGRCADVASGRIAIHPHQPQWRSTNRAARSRVIGTNRKEFPRLATTLLSQRTNRLGP